MKTSQNNFTTPEQSKRLLVFGVPADSADCYYTAPYYGHIWIKSDVDKIDWNAKVCGKSFFIPCWSVGRLMKIFLLCTPYKEISLHNEDLVEQMVVSISMVRKDNLIDFSKLEE